MTRHELHSSLVILLNLKIGKSEILDFLPLTMGVDLMAGMQSRDMRKPNLENVIEIITGKHQRILCDRHQAWKELFLSLATIVCNLG